MPRDGVREPQLLGSRDGSNGVPPGNYRVVISKRLMPNGTDVPADDTTPPMASPAKESLPPTFSSVTSTTLSATVPATGGPVDFQLKDPKKK